MGLCKEARVECKEAFPMKRYELEDRDWERIRDLVPKGKQTGRPKRDDRELMNGMFWVLRSGAPWRDMPGRYGPWQTVYDRFNRWRKDGTLKRIAAKLRKRMHGEGRIDRDLWCVDSTMVRASRAAAGAGKKGGLKNP
jgi:transposase